ncbi:hypothetical protein FB451DRAFT_1195874 [Mycena latifolia]|nr:hypothetical protein FB451DRAFT_1195874 [Mycena latifolia]
MSTHRQPDYAMAAFIQPRRIYMACVNCRAGKVKTTFTEATSALGTYSTHAARMDSGFSGVRSIGQRKPATAEPGLLPAKTASQFNPGPSVPTPMTQPNRYPPKSQYPPGGDYIPYNYGGSAFQAPLPQLGHPSSNLANQQPAAPEYHSEYQHYFANFGHNDVSYPADIYPGRMVFRKLLDDESHWMGVSWFKRGKSKKVNKKKWTALQYFFLDVYAPILLVILFLDGNEEDRGKEQE